MSNHSHLVIRDNDGNFPEFLAHFHKMIAKAMNAYLGRWENFWATQQANAVYLVEPEDRFRKLVYTLANPVAGDLVDRVSDWPGASSLALHLSGGTQKIKRPKGYFRNQGSAMPAEVTLRVERVDGFEDLSDAEWIEKLSNALRQEEETARERRRKNGQEVLGRKGVLNTTPTEKPRSVEPRRGLRPAIACRNTARFRTELVQLIAFRKARRVSLDRLREGGSDIFFPPGTYHIRGVFQTAPLAA